MSHRRQEIPVTLQPLGRVVHVLPGTKLLEAAAGAGVAIDVPCGGEGICGKCRVIVRGGNCPATAAQQNLLPAEELAAGVRLACQSAVCEPLVIEVPDTSQVGTFHKILAHGDDQAGGLVAPVALDPAVRKQYVELEPPRRGHDAPDLRRLEAALGPHEVGLDLLAELPGRLRTTQFRGTAVLANGSLLDFEPGDTRGQSFAVAVDVGTTTLAATLLDLTSGHPLQVATRINPQTSFGDDVLSRILFAQKEGGLAQLQGRVVAAVDEMIGQLAAAAGILRRQIYEIALAGNTTMQQLVCGIDPRALGEMPFVPAVGRSFSVPAVELGLAMHPRGRAVFLPVVGGFVGGDTVAGMLATRLAEMSGPALLIDIGTNGEIVLAAGGRLRAASTAAGPAFEGARISHGMRGSAGAIEKVIVTDGQLQYNVIGDVRPIGLCGSALIDLAAELLRHDIITPAGRLQTPGDLPPGTAHNLVERIVPHEGKPAFLVAAADETGTGRPIMLTQRDIRELQLASGAIRAGIVILLAEAGLRPADLECVLLAGGFGNFIRRKNAQRIGLLPAEIAHDRIRYQGNTSLAGAQLVALSRRARRRADELAEQTAHVDLGFNPAFQAAFADAMIFPTCP